MQGMFLGAHGDGGDGVDALANRQLQLQALRIGTG